jgi:hypothetical protein
VHPNDGKDPDAHRLKLFSQTLHDHAWPPSRGDSRTGTANVLPHYAGAVIALRRIVLFADYGQFYVQDLDAHNRAMLAVPHRPRCCAAGAAVVQVTCRLQTSASSARLISEGET